MDRQSAMSVAEAAAQLGMSTLRLRAHLHAGHLDAYRDNRGQWRVHLDGRALPALPEAPDERRINELLVEELLELREAQAAQEETIGRLTALAQRQQELLARAVERAEANDAAAGPALERALRLAEQAVSRAEAETARAEGRIRARDALLERALRLLEGLVREVESPRPERGLLDRLLRRGSEG
ncbi:MAG TPA: hypothetical protein VFN46_03130 [Acetobacteraceae bacterium]|nr:hypothetical protein [Acetobacteraceae bacterium]